MRVLAVQPHFGLTESGSETIVEADLERVRGIDVARTGNGRHDLVVPTLRDFSCVRSGDPAELFWTKERPRTSKKALKKRDRWRCGLQRPIRSCSVRRCASGFTSL